MYCSSIVLMIVVLFHTTPILANDHALRRVEKNVNVAEANKEIRKVQQEDQIRTGFDDDEEAKTVEYHEIPNSAAYFGAENGHQQGGGRLHGGRAARLIRSVFPIMSMPKGLVMPDNWHGSGAGDVYANNGAYRHHLGHADQTGSD